MVAIASPESIAQRYEIRAAITLSMVVGTFILLWMPGIACLFIISTTGNRNFSIDVLELSVILVHLNAAIDPLIYAYRMNNIRQALNKLFRCFIRRGENTSIELKPSAPPIEIMWYTRVKSFLKKLTNKFETRVKIYYVTELTTGESHADFMNVTLDFLIHI